MMNWDRVRNENKYRQGSKTRILKEPKGFKSKYEGKCIMCKKTIKIGDIIKMFDKGKAYHIGCI